MKACVSCKKEFMPKKSSRIFCSMACYRKRNQIKETNEFDVGQMIFDAAMIMTPILILAFAVFFITPKTVNWITKEETKTVKNIPDSCCDEFEFEINDEDMKFRDFIKTGRGK